MFTGTILCWLITLLFFQCLIYQDGCILDTEVTGITTEKQQPLCLQLSFHSSCLGWQLNGSKFFLPWITTDSPWYKCNRVHGPMVESIMRTNTGMMQFLKKLVYTVQRQGNGQQKLFYILCPAHLSFSHTSLFFSHKPQVINNKGKEKARRRWVCYMFWHTIACDVMSGRNTCRTRISAVVQRRAEVVISGKLRKKGFCF